MDNSLDARTISAMQENRPTAKFRKTIPAKVCVKVLNSFSGLPEEMILVGDEHGESASVSLFSVRESVFFNRSNKKLLDDGKLISVPVEVEEVQEEVSIEQYTDEQLTQVVNKKFADLEKVVSGITSEAVMFRMIKIAMEREKGPKTIELLNRKLSLLQGARVD